MKVLSLVFTIMIILLVPKYALADSLVINEFMAKPDDETEWIELYNPTSQAIDLTGWKLKDGNSSTTDDLTLSGSISALGFVSFDHNKGWLNDTGTETITLLDNSSGTIDSYSYSGASSGKTYGRQPDGESWQSSLIATKGSTNGGSTSSSSSPSTISTFTISGVPSQIDSTQNFTVSINLELSSYPNTKFYLKGAFAKSGSTNYFGFTKINGSWVKNGSTYSDQYQITTDSSGKWSGNLDVSVDAMDSGYEGTNDYIFKAGRYTASGNGPTWTSEASVKINAKEVESEGGVIDLSKLSAKSTPEVLSEQTKNTNTLPEEIYSLENYRRSATISSTPSAQPIVIKANKQNLIIPLIGGLLLGSGLGFAVFIFMKNRVK